MENHEKVARTHRALSWLYMLCLALLVVVVVIGRQLNIELFLLLIFMGGLFLLHRATAKGALEQQSWARTTSRIIGILMLPGFPLGSAIGIYLLINSTGWEEETA